MPRSGGHGLRDLAQRHTLGGVPQVSADTHLPVPPDVATALTSAVTPQPVRRPPWVRPTGIGWRVRPERGGAQVVLWASYAVQPAWVRPLVHEVTQWLLARQLRARVAQLDERASAQEVG